MESQIYGKEKNSSEDITIRPADFNEFIGQREAVDNLKVYLKAASLRNEVLDHILFSGPPGLGKTTLAKILAGKQEGQFYQVSAPNLKRPGDLAKILSTLNENDILFLDEIHRLPAPVEEILYPALEDRQIDITLAEGLGATTVTIDIPPFTLVGATTKPGNLSSPLRDRFGIHLRLDFYNIEDIAKIISNAAKKWRISINADALNEIAQRSRRTPRIALRLLRRVWDYAIVGEESQGEKNTVIDVSITDHSFTEMRVDKLGLTALDNEFLRILAVQYKGGPVGLKPLSAILSEDLITLEDFVEPFMIRLDLIQRTSRGRMLTNKGYEHIHIQPPGVENDLFN
ncbi:MAG: Holliday junction branch migration DNA helicase RuvB [Leptospirales bacterium]